MDENLKLIKGVSTDEELLSLANQLGLQIDDVLISNQIGLRKTPWSFPSKSSSEDFSKPLSKKKSYLILLKGDQDIGHWVCCDKGNWFDSMGIGPPSGFGIEQYNKKQYQGTYDNYCGIWCLVFLVSRQKKRPQLLSGFFDLNDDTFET